MHSWKEISAHGRHPHLQPSAPVWELLLHLGAGGRSWGWVGRRRGRYVPDGGNGYQVAQLKTKTAVLIVHPARLLAKFRKSTPSWTGTGGRRTLAEDAQRLLEPEDRGSRPRSTPVRKLHAR